MHRSNSKSWKPGQSGNPEGRPRRSEELDEAVRRRAGDTAEALVGRVYKLLDDPKSPPELVLSCATWLRDVGWGKPKPRRRDDAIGRGVRAALGGVDDAEGQEVLIRMATKVLTDATVIPASRARELAELILGLPAEMLE